MLLEENRKSMQTHLARGDYDRAENKIENLIQDIILNIASIRDYSESLVKENISYGNEVIEKTKEYFESSIILLKDFKEHKFLKYSTRLSFLKKIANLENQITTAKRKFNEIVKKIKQKNSDLIVEERKSILNSRRGTDASKDDKLFEERLLELTKEELITFDLENTMIQEREDQIELILKVMNEINNLSKDCLNIAIQSGQKVDKISENIFTVEINTNKALEEIKEAESINSSQREGFYSVNKIIVILGIFVSFLFLVVLSKA
jgi:hypothetical protein